MMLIITGDRDLPTPTPVQARSSSPPSSSSRSTQRNQIEMDINSARRDATRNALDITEGEVEEKGEGEGSKRGAEAEVYRWGQLESSTQRVGRLLPLQLAALYKSTNTAAGEKKDKNNNRNMEKVKSDLSLDAAREGEKPQEVKSSQHKRQLEYSKGEVEGWRQLDAVFGVTDAYTPLVIFRRPAYTGGWAVKKLALRSTRCSHQLDNVLREVITSLLVNRVVPYNMIHVEHCVDCEAHQNTTRHEPGSYERAFKDFRTEFKKKMPPSLIYGNNTKVCLSNLPFRMGSFEVLFRPYNSTQTRFIYSKLQSNEFPDSAVLASELKTVMLPEVWKFSSESVAMLEVLAFDACTKKPIAGAEVSVYLVCVSTHNMDDDLEGLEQTDKGKEEEREREKSRERRATKEARRAVTTDGSISGSGISSDSINVAVSKRLSPSGSQPPSRVRPHSAGPARLTSTFVAPSASIHRANSPQSKVKAEPQLPSSFQRANTYSGTGFSAPAANLSGINLIPTHSPLHRQSSNSHLACQVKGGGAGKKAPTFKYYTPPNVFPESKSEAKVAASEPGLSLKRPFSPQSPSVPSSSSSPGREREREGQASLFTDRNRDRDRQQAPPSSLFSGVTPLKRPKSAGATRVPLDGQRTMTASPYLTQAKLKQLAEASYVRQENENKHLEAGRKREKERDSRAKAAAATAFSSSQSRMANNIRTWTKMDVLSWFREYGASEEVVENALFAGVVDGPSFSGFYV